LLPISHDVTGSGPSALLIHAGVADRRMWDPQLPAIARGHRVVRVDLRGFGDSPLPPDPYDHVTDIITLLEDIGVDRTAVVGASFGGLVAQELARRHPERIERLLLLCPASVLLRPDDELKAFWSREEVLLESGDLAAATTLNVDTWCGPEASSAIVGVTRGGSSYVARSRAGVRGWGGDLPRRVCGAGHAAWFGRARLRSCGRP